MKILTFSTSNKIANCNRYYGLNSMGQAGNYMSVTDIRNTPEATAAHTYTGVYYGVFYGDISSNSTTEYMIHYKTESLVNGSWCLGIRVRVLGTSLVLELIEGTFFNGDTPSPTEIYSSNTVTIPTGFCQVAWYMCDKPGLENTTSIWLNKAELSLASYPVGPAVSRKLPTNVIFSQNVPLGFKMSTLWSGFNYATTKADFQKILNNWTGKIPYFMGRFGEYPLGGIPATTYIDCSEQTILDRPVEGYYTKTGIADYSYNYDFVQVPSIP